MVDFLSLWAIMLTGALPKPATDAPRAQKGYYLSAKLLCVGYGLWLIYGVLEKIARAL